MSLRAPLFGALLLSVVATSAWSAVLDVQVFDKKGRPLQGIVVSIHGEGISAAAAQHIALQQDDKRFAPQITLVPVGSTVAFINKDNITHHVYSFSKPWRRQFRLAKNETRDELMDSAGEIVLGCNVHDWMLGYIYVMDTPYYGMTKASGDITFANLPRGNLTLLVRHPRIRDGRGVVERAIVISTDQSQQQIRLSKSLLPMRDQVPEEGEYD